MKEIISAVVTLAILVGGGTAALRGFHEVRRAALEKAAKGLPSLEAAAFSLQKKRARRIDEAVRAGENEYQLYVSGCRAEIFSVFSRELEDVSFESALIPAAC